MTVGEAGRYRCNDPDCTHVNSAPPGECLARQRARAFTARRAQHIAKTGIAPVVITWYDENDVLIPEGANKGLVDLMRRFSNLKIPTSDI